MTTRGANDDGVRSEVRMAKSKVVRQTIEVSAPGENRTRLRNGMRITGILLGARFERTTTDEVKGGEVAVVSKLSVAKWNGAR